MSHTNGGVTSPEDVSVATMRRGVGCESAVDAHRPANRLGRRATMHLVHCGKPKSPTFASRMKYAPQQAVASRVRFGYDPPFPKIAAQTL